MCEGRLSPYQKDVKAIAEVFQKSGLCAGLGSFTIMRSGDDITTQQMSGGGK